MRRALLPLLAGALLGSVLPESLPAQLAGGADLTVQSTYVWRGVRRAAAPVLQPSVFLSWQPRGWTVTTGAWANLELARARLTDPTDAGRARRFSELDYWAEAHTRTRGLDLRFGTVRYDLRGDSLTGGRGAVWDTGEVYGAAAALLGNLTVLGLTAAYDYAAVNGTYVTFEATQHVPIVGVHGLMLSGMLRGVLGASYGQELAGGSDEQAYFSEAGVTHIDLSGAARVHSQSLGVYAALHWQFNQDEFTRRITMTRNRARQYWLDAGFSILLGSLPRERR